MKKTPLNLSPDGLPPSIRQYLHQARCYDSSCSEASQTIYIESGTPAYLKISPSGSLAREVAMTRFLHSHHLAPQVLEYNSTDDRDHLLTEALDGEDGIAEHHLADPQRLSETFGQSLRLIHQLPLADCPFPDRMQEMTIQARTNIARGYIDSSIITEDMSTAAERFLHIPVPDWESVVIHGDYCLPNIIMRNFRLSGFVDLGTGGIGDPHYDLFWAIWTLKYNLKTEKYRQRFLDAYGRSAIDPYRLDYCRLLSGFTK